MHFIEVKQCFWYKNGYFLCNISQENVSYDTLERKNALLGYKKKSWKSLKIDVFPKELTHRFGPKMNIFKAFF